MEKGQSILVQCIGSVGSVVRDFDTKEVITGSYRHTQTVGGVSYSWKCGALSLTGVVKLVADEFTGTDGKVNKFFRMEGMADSAAAVTNIKTTFEALTAMAW